MKKGSDPKTKRENIAALIRAGKSVAEAVAISLEWAMKPKMKSKRRKRRK